MKVDWIEWATSKPTDEGWYYVCDDNEPPDFVSMQRLVKVPIDTKFGQQITELRTWPDMELLSEVQTITHWAKAVLPKHAGFALRDEG